MIGDLALFNAVSYFGVQALPRTDDCDFGVGIEKIEDATSCDLEYRWRSD